MFRAYPEAVRRWYARRNGTVRGPFTDELMTRYIVLGRIRLEDELSLDRVGWRPAREYSELFPEELLRLSNGDDYQRLLVMRTGADERTVNRRRVVRHAASPFNFKERRVLTDRRAAGVEADFMTWHLRKPLPRSTDSRRRQPLRIVLLATVLMTLAFAYFSMYSR